MKVLAEHLRARGLYVFILPEVASVLMNSGFFPPDFYEHDLPHWDASRIGIQTHLETAALALCASKAAPSVVLTDRGILDGQAFAPQGIWEQAVSATGINKADVFARYSMIVHMQSVAVDMPHAYDFTQNPSRYHTLEEAAASDLLLADTYRGHRRFRSFDNELPLPGKIAAICTWVEAHVITDVDRSEQ